MTEWSALNPLRDILINYYFGSPVAFFFSVCLIVFVALVTAGLEMRLAFVLSLPLVGTFGLYGLFGDFTWVSNTLLLIVGFIYTYAIIEIYT